VTKSECRQAVRTRGEDYPIYRYAVVLNREKKTVGMAARMRLGTTEARCSTGETASSSFRSAVVSLIIFDGSPGRGSPVFSAKSTASRESD
jgi:hypothetical protein